MDQRPLAACAGIGHRIARLEIVGAVDHEVVARRPGRAAFSAVEAQLRAVRPRTCGLMRGDRVAAALSTLAAPIDAVSWITCRCRLDSDTVSSSTMPSVPTPAAARYSQHRRAEAAGADHQHARALQLLLARRRRSPAARCGGHSVRVLPGQGAVWFMAKAYRPELACQASSVGRIAAVVDGEELRATFAGSKTAPASVPVMKAWQSSSSRIANRAARRPSSRCAAISSSSRMGAWPDISPASLACDKHDADQQRLLLAGRAQLGRHRLRPVADERDRNGAGRPACARRRGRGRGRRQVPGGSAPRPRRPARRRSRSSRSPASASSACGNGPSSGQPVDHRRQQPDQFRRGRRRSPRRSRPSASRSPRTSRGRGESSESSRLRPRIAFSIVERALAVAGIDRQHQPVEEAPAVAGRAGEQRVHRRASARPRAAIRAVRRRIGRWRR